MDRNFLLKRKFILTFKMNFYFCSLVQYFSCKSFLTLKLKSIFHACLVLPLRGPGFLLHIYLIHIRLMIRPHLEGVFEEAIFVFIRRWLHFFRDLLLLCTMQNLFKLQSAPGKDSSYHKTSCSGSKRKLLRWYGVIPWFLIASRCPLVG